MRNDIKIFLAAIMLVVPMFTGCSKPDIPIDEPKDEIEVPDAAEVEKPDVPVKPQEKPKVIWIDASANFSRFKKKINISYFMNKLKEIGINTVVVDVKPCQGNVMYPSEFMPMCKTVGGVPFDIEWDYLQAFIDKARELDMKVTVSTTFFPMGSPGAGIGPVYESNIWNGKTCQVLTKDGLKDIKDCPDKVAAFLNPVLPEVQEYLLRMVSEIVTKYDIDSYALDYCRYCDEYSDFSEASKVAFEKWAGITVENFPDDIMTISSRGTKIEGKHYYRWLAFRATVIHDFVAKVEQTIHAIKPDVKVEYWAGSWWHAIRGNGQNWGNPEIDARQFPNAYAYSWYTPEYQKAGFADHLDVFQLGAYLTRVYGHADNESIEFAIIRAKQLIGDACKLYGTISLNKDWESQCVQATELCLLKTDGIMLFDMVYLVKYDLWDEVKEGIDKAEKALGIVK